jgi:hypothetical protein
MTIEQIERRWQQRANTMTLSEVETELVRLPTTPKNDDQLIGRAVMAKRRGELVDASRPNPNDPPPDPVGLVEVFVPEGGAGCVQSRTMRGKYFYSELRDDGRQIIKLPWYEFVGIANATTGSGAGPNGQCWWEANPHLKAMLPVNPPPPPAAPLQE